MITITLNGKENGKNAYLVQHKVCGQKITFASIVFDGTNWVLKRLPSGRIDRFGSLRDATEDARKG